MPEFGYSFVKQSNAIESIFTEPSAEEMEEYHRFMALDSVTVEDMVQCVSVYQPDAILRKSPSDPNVQVGDHVAPTSGPAIVENLQKILDRANKESGYHSSFDLHVKYETLHPFTDGNGRSGRMLWRWQVREYSMPSLSFLQVFYYQTLSNSNERKN